MHLSKLMATTALAVLIALPLAAQAQQHSVTVVKTTTAPTTVKEQVKVTQKNIPGANKVYFTDFDANKDGILSMNEVGDRLFKSFDRDGNGTLDNHEWEGRSVITIVPVEKQTLRMVDNDSDGSSETSTYSTEDFMQKSGLARFDKDGNGLSPHEFTGKSFKEADLSAAGGSYAANSNGYVNKKEFQTVYRMVYAHKQDNPDIYNK